MIGVGYQNPAPDSGELNLARYPEYRILSCPMETCWTVIRGAAAGEEADREEFVRRYGPVVRAYLHARWRWPPHHHEVDDAFQEVFLDCFKAGGALDRLEQDRPGGFRAFFYGVIRNVARRAERNQARCRVRPADSSLNENRFVADEESLSHTFDRVWAEGIVSEARRRLTNEAAARDQDALRRVELLRLRFEDGVPIRQMARRWNVDPAHLHHEYAKARREFRDALVAVVASHHPGSRSEIILECTRLLELLG